MKRAFVLAIGVLALAASSGCSMAPTPCQIQTGEYVVQFTPTGTPQAGCPPQFADVWAFQPYLDVEQRVLIVGFSETLGTPDPVGNYKDSPLYLKGNFTSVDPDGNDLCTIATASISDGTTTFGISQMNWLSTALYLGTQFEADVTYSDATCAGAPYQAHAINPPVIGCTTNADCDPFATPVSSGINSNYNQGCNLDAWATDFTGDGTGICFFNEEFPSLGGFPGP